jgi:hypothetical protein
MGQGQAERRCAQARELTLEAFAMSPSLSLYSPLASAMSLPPPGCSVAVAGRFVHRHRHRLDAPRPLAYGATPQYPLSILLHRDAALLTYAHPRLTLAVGFGSAAGAAPAPSRLRLLHSAACASSTSSTTSTTTSRAPAPLPRRRRPSP